MRKMVINSTPTMLPIDIVFPNEGGRKDTVFIQGKSKAKLPPGAEVTTEFLLMNSKVRQVDMDENPQQVSLVSPSVE